MQNKLLSVLNTFVFLSKRSKDCLKSIEKLSSEIQYDFLLAVQKLITESKEWRNKKIPFTYLSRADFESDITFILAYHKLLNPTNFRAPAGFTPKLSFLPQTDFTGKKIMGLNCLGRAITLGIFLKYHGYKIMFGTRPSHAVVIVEIEDQMYYCDPQDDRLFKLHGQIKKHEGYQWYETDSKDDLFSNFFVFHEFSIGIVNAILGNLGFLQTSQEYDPYDENDCLLHAVRNVFDTSTLDSLHLNKIQEYYCTNLDKYKQRYKIPYLLECERVKKRIHQRELQKRFDHIAFEAYEKATGQQWERGKLKEFLDIHMPIMQQYGEEIIRSFERGCEFVRELPDDIIRYLSHIKTQMAKDSRLQLHVLSKMKSKLLLNQLIKKFSN